MRYLISIKGFCVPNLRLVNVLIVNIFIYNSTVPAENLELLHRSMRWRYFVSVLTVCLQ